jgi:2-polyprenyl-3-methyl-5-hydroxy-6-metoxy-1,4-benzoquinol methylase
MRSGAKPDNLMERALLTAGLVPTPFLDTFIGLLLVRTVLTATKLGVFEALADSDLTCETLSERIETDPRATGKLLDSLVASDYLTRESGRYGLAPTARRWMLADSPKSLRDFVLFREYQWDLLKGYEEFVRNGVPVGLHQGMPPEGWPAYQRAMRALAGLGADEVCRRLPVPDGATTMLDIGGAHGFFSVSMCRRYPDLRATVLDLPDAIAGAAPILAREGMGDRVTQRSGNALEDDLGDASWDIVLMAQVAHHFDEPSNRALASRIATALKPGGVFALLEVERPSDERPTGQSGALMDLYFAFTSESGTWTAKEMAEWQLQAGLHIRNPIRLRRSPGAIIQVGVKPGGPPRRGGRGT